MNLSTLLLAALVAVVGYKLLSGPKPLLGGNASPTANPYGGTTPAAQQQPDAFSAFLGAATTIFKAVDDYSQTSPSTN